MKEEAQQQPLCAGGHAVTLWGLEIEDIPVYYFRMEGGELSVSDRDKLLTFYSDVIAKNDRFVTLYDLTNGMSNFSSHIVPFANFCNTMRPITQGRLKFSITVCPNALYRSFLSVILRMAPTHAPFYVVATLEEAWNVLAQKGEGEQVWDPESELVSL